MPASRRQRSYESPLRAEQMDRTREKLIAAGIDLLAEAGREELTVRRVAARARVSVPTAYRHFPDRDALFEQMAASINQRIGGPGIPATIEALSTWIRLVYRNFEAHDRLMRAQLSTPAGNLLRARNQKARRPLLMQAIGRAFPAATPTAQHRLAAVFQLLCNVPGWVALHDQWGMNGDEAGQLAAWAMETLVAELRRRPGALDFQATPALPVLPPAPVASASPAPLASAPAPATEPSARTAKRAPRRRR